MGKPKQTLEGFIKNAQSVHAGKYTYEKSIYTNNHTKTIITCPVHGDFEQTPNKHTQGRGCPTCYLENKSYTKEQFVKRASEIHKNKYSYEKTNYTTGDNFITITCPLHGDFEQRAKVHLHGCGCTKCANINRGSWTKDKWDLCKDSSNFTGFKLYVIECWNETERFIKIGRTSLSISFRFAPSRMPYSWKLLHMEEGSSDYIFDLEKTMLAAHASLKYTPITLFDGSTECFSSYLHIKDN